jgi:predicted DNA-binding transcriptional regulator AlpA
MPASNENTPPNLTIVAVASKVRDEPSLADLIDEPALAARLGVPRSTLQSWQYTGRGPQFIKLGRMIRYRTADVDAYPSCEHARQGCVTTM